MIGSTIEIQERKQDAWEKYVEREAPNYNEVRKL